jgi:hypothetical protein
MIYFGYRMLLSEIVQLEKYGHSHTTFTDLVH